jgi:hypothetical protein
MILVWVSSYGGDFFTATMTGETFVEVPNAESQGTGDQNGLGCFAVNSANGGQTQVDVTNDNGDPTLVVIIEIQGQGASPQDATGNETNGTFTVYSVSTSTLTSNTNDLVIAAFAGDATASWTHGISYSQVESVVDSDDGFSLFCESTTVSLTGIQIATANGASGEESAQGIMAISSGAAPPSVKNPPHVQMF